MPRINRSQRSRKSQKREDRLVEGDELAFILPKVTEDKLNDSEDFYSKFWSCRIKMDYNIEERPPDWTWKKVYFAYKIRINYIISNHEMITYDSSTEEN